MGNYLVKRLLYGFLVLWGVVTLVFFLFNMLPGDASRMLLGQRADISSVNAIKKELGLDKPPVIQYLNFLNDLSPISIHNNVNPKSYWFLNPDKYPHAIKLIRLKNSVIVLKTPFLRRSFQSKRLVTSIIEQAFPKTFILATTSIIIAIILGFFLGIPAAIYKDSFYDRFIMTISSFGMSVPSFFAAIFIAWLFGFVWHHFTGLSMFGSLYSVDPYTGAVYVNLKNLILPAITLGIRPLAVIVSLVRSSLLEVMSQDYIRTAYAKGLSRQRVILRHALRNALNPLITAVSGWFASLLAGAVFVEYVFDWKGIGLVMVNALEKYDLPVVMGVVLFIAILLILINILVDITYAILDPRVKFS